MQTPLATAAARNGNAPGHLGSHNAHVDTTPDGRMSAAAQCAVVIWLLVSAIVTFSGLVWMWPVAIVLNAKDAAPALEMRWFGPDFAATAMTSLIIVVALSAVAGSVVQLIMVFTLRAGYGTLEHRYIWWYLLRPIAAALLGIVFFLAVHAGVTTVGDTGAANLPLLATSGALTGLYTDRVFQRLQSLLGATDASRPASAQQIPAQPA